MKRENYLLKVKKCSTYNMEEIYTNCLSADRLRRKTGNKRLKTRATVNFHKVRIYKMEEESLSKGYFEMSNSDVAHSNEGPNRKPNLRDSALC
jgi:hypothetical protein